MCIYAIHIPTDTQTYTHTDTHMHICTLFIIQVSAF